MQFGTQYYRPPFPDAQNWRRDLTHIKNGGFNTVKLWAVWNWIERSEGCFHFDELDALVALCAELRLNVIINTIIEGAPYWTSRYEAAMYESETGEKLHYSGPGNIPSAGWPGLCMDHPEAERLACRFIERVAAQYRDQATVTTIDVWNEPHLEPTLDYAGRLFCCCKHSQEQFVQWLQSRYETLDALNAAWLRCYTDWSQIEPPIRFGTATDMIDFRRFWLSNLQRWLRLRVEAAKRGAPEKVIQTHMAFSGYMGANNHGGLGNELCDEFLLSREVDSFGLSMFPLWLLGERHVDEHFINLALIAAAAREKPFYQVELQGGAGKAGLLGGRVPQPSDIRQWNWSVIAAGGKGVLYWQYLPEPAGLESPGFGLVNANGSDTPRSLEAFRCATRFLAEMPEDASVVSTDNAIFLSRNADLFAYAGCHEDMYTHSFAGVFRALLHRGVPVRFVHADDAADRVMQSVQTLYVPMALSLSAQEREALRRFVLLGGKLALECCAGLYDEHGVMDANAAFFAELFGAQNLAVEPVSPEANRAVAVDGEASFASAYYRNTFSKIADDCIVSARYPDGMAAIVERTFGKGRAILINGFAGIQYYETDDTKTGDFLAALFDKNGYDCLASLEAKQLLFRMRQTDTDYILVCVNRTSAPQKMHALFRNGARITETVPPDDGILLRVPKVQRGEDGFNVARPA